VNTNDLFSSSEHDNEAGCPNEFSLLWTLPNDVASEWTALSKEELWSLSLILESLLSEIDKTLAVVAINAKLLPIAANELKKCLKDFRLSLKDTPFPKEAATKTLQ
jgi:hypothetical protein